VAKKKETPHLLEIQNTVLAKPLAEMVYLKRPTHSWFDVEGAETEI
jgi:hypothetical protein